MTKTTGYRLTDAALVQIAGVLADASSYEQGHAPAVTAEASALRTLETVVRKLPFYVYSLTGPVGGPFRLHAVIGDPEAVLGRDHAELSAIDAREVVHPDELPYHDEVAASAINEGEFYDVMGRAAPIDGEERWFVSLGCAERHEGGGLEFVGITVKSRRVAALKAALEEDAQRFEDLAANLPGAVYQYRMGSDGTLSVPYISEGIEQVLGASAAEVMREPDSMSRYVLPEEIPELVESIRRSAETLEPWQRVYRVGLPSGEVKALYGAGRPRRLEDGSTLWNSIVIDITEVERRNAEERRRQRESFEAQKLESLGRLASGVAHDLNNLLVGVMANAGLVAEMAGGEAAAIAHEIEEAARRSAELTEQILAYAGRGRIRSEVVDLRVLVREMVNLNQRARRPGVKVQLLLPDSPVWVRGDPTQLRQVILNLVSNAEESRTDGSYVDETHVEVRLEGNHEHAILTVSDDGPGVPESHRARIFEPFFTTKPRGRGLGLAVVAGVVRGHSGELTLGDAEAGGAAFTVRLPISGSTAHSVPNETRGPAPPPGRVLVIDDEEAVRKTTERLLSARGFQVELAGSGSEGLAKYRPGIFDWVVLDLTMPEQSGSSVLESIRAVAPEQAVVLFSGYAETELDAILAGDERVTFLPKPFNGPRLFEAMARLAAKHDRS